MILFRQFLVTLFVLAVAIINPTADAQPAGLFTLEGTIRGGGSIFAPGQPAILDVVLRPSDVILRPPSPNVVPFPLPLHAELVNLSLPDRPTIAGFTTEITSNVPLPLSFVTPDKDGVYEIRLTVIQSDAHIVVGGSLLSPIRRQEPVVGAETRLQFVVLGGQVPLRPTGDWTLTDRRNLSPFDDSSADSSSRRLLP